MAQTLMRTIRVTPEQWDRIEKIAKDRDVSANRLVVELVMESLERRGWPHTELVSCHRLYRRRLLPDERGESHAANPMVTLEEPERPERDHNPGRHSSQKVLNALILPSVTRGGFSES